MARLLEDQDILVDPTVAAQIHLEAIQEDFPRLTPVAGSSDMEEVTLKLRDPSEDSTNVDTKLNGSC